MPTDLVKQESPGGSLAAQLMQVVRENPTAGAENLKALLDAAERMNAWQAKCAFDQAMSRLQPRIPRIQKTRAITVKGTLRSKYAAYEDIDRILRPLYTSEGFSVSFTTERAGDRDMRIIGRLKHVDGHEEPSELTFPFDKSDFRSDVQSWGSTEQYGKRRVLCNMFNVVTENEDNDGAGAAITRAQREEIERWMTETGTNESHVLDMYGVKTLDDLPAINLGGLRGLMTTKLRKKMQGDGHDQENIDAAIKRLFG